MKIITDEILHLYIINKQLLEVDFLKEIDEQLKSSDIMKKRIEAIKLFYTELNNVERKKLEMTSTGKESISLYPFEFNYNNTLKYAKLAADTVNDDKKIDAYKYVKTFASAENLYLMRLHHNPVKNEFKLYILSEDAEKISNLKIRIPELNLEFVSDENGVIDLKNHNISGVNSIIIEK